MTSEEYKFAQNCPNPLFSRQLNDIERNVLDILSLEVSVLENERDVESLNSYYVTKLEIQEKQSVIHSTRTHIDNQRFAYFPIAKHATELFQITSEFLANSVINNLLTSLCPCRPTESDEQFVPIQFGVVWSDLHEQYRYQ